MNKKTENIDQFFKNELGDFSSELPLDAWDNISQQLASNKKRILPFYFKIAASVALFLVGGITALILLNNNYPTDTNQLSSENINYSDDTETPIHNNPLNEQAASIPDNNSSNNLLDIATQNDEANRKQSELYPKNKTKKYTLENKIQSTSPNKESNNSLIAKFNNNEPETKHPISDEYTNSSDLNTNDISAQSASTSQIKLSSKTEATIPQESQSSSTKGEVNKKGIYSSPNTNINNSTYAELNESSTSKSNNNQLQPTIKSDNTEPKTTSGSKSQNDIPSSVNNNLFASNGEGQNYTSPDQIRLKQVRNINGLIKTTSPSEEIVVHEKEAFAEELLAYDEPVYKQITYKEERVSQSKWFIGGQAGPQYTYRNIASENTASSLLANYNASEDGVVAYAGGVNVEYSPVRRLSIQSGVYYSKMGQEKSAIQSSPNLAITHEQRWNPTYTENQTTSYKVTNSTGDIVFNNIPTATNGDDLNQLDVNTSGIESVGTTSTSTSSDEIPLTQQFEYIEVPLIARYTIVDRKVGIHLLGGVSTNFLVGNSVYLDSQSDEAVGYTEGVSEINYSSTMGFGIGYSMTGNLKFTIEPQVKYYLTKQIEDSNIDVHPYSIGVMTGVKYLF